MQQASVVDYPSREKWMRGVIADHGLTEAQRLIAIRLALFLDVRTGLCCPSYATLADEVGFNRSTAIKAVNALVEHQWLAPTNSAGRNSNRFVFRFPDSFIDDAEIIFVPNGRAGATVEFDDQGTDGFPAATDEPPSVSLARPLNQQRSRSGDPNENTNTQYRGELRSPPLSDEDYGLDEDVSF